MGDLDRIDGRMEWLRERVVSAVSFLVASTVASILVSELRAYFVLVSLGAAGWALTAGARLRSASRDREAMLDRLVLAGSCDPRCERRRAYLGSAQLHHRLARMLRQTCEHARYRTPSAMWMVDHQIVHAVERDLRELATVFDTAAGHLPPTAVALVRLLVASPSSPLYQLHPTAESERRAIQTTERILARCRAELDG
jgi:hypothetical protein